jgi:hypothetical protein
VRSGDATPYDPLAHTSISSSGPFTTTIVGASNLSVGAGAIVIFLFKAHLTASAPFRAGPPGPYPAGYPGRPAGGASHRVPFPATFRPPAFASRSSDSRRRVGPSSRSAYQTRHRRARTPTGLPRSARTSCDRGGCPLYPEDGGALPGLRDVLSRRLPLDGDQSSHPAPASHRQGSASRGINEGSRDSPVRSSPRL